MQILDNGNVRITNKRTGEIKEVSPNDLGQYNIPMDAYLKLKGNSPAAAFTPSGNMAQDIVGSTRPGINYNRADVQSYYDAKLNQDDPYGLKKEQAVAEAKAKMEDLGKLKEKAVFNSQNVQNAKDILDLLQKKDAGQIDPEAFNTQLNLLASKQAAHIGFGIGGKVLSEGEKAILQPQMANLAKSKTVEKGNILQRGMGFLSGAPVPQIERTQELLQDTPEQLKAKMLATIQAYGLDSDKKQYAAMAGSTKATAPTQPEPSGISGLIQNAGADAKDIANGILNLPAIAVNSAKDSIVNGRPEDFNPLMVAGKTAVNVGKGLVNEYNQLLGDPLSGGDIVGRIGDRAYKKPVSTALDILPLIGAVKKIGALSKGAKGAQIAEEAALGSDAVAAGSKAALPEISSGRSGILNDIKGRAATDIGVVAPADVARSEAMMGDALKMTKSFTRRGMSKELGDFVPKAGKAIDSWAAVNDAKIGPQPLNEILAQVESNLSKNVVAQANPELVKETIDKLRNSLKSTTMDPSMNAATEGAQYGTTISKINETRKMLNSSIPDGWFETKGTVSKADNLSHLNWEASKTLKDIMAQADETGQIKDLINKQHVALETKPVLSKLALSKSGVSPSVWREVLKALDTGTEPIRIGAARMMQGGYSPISLPKIQPK